MFKFTDNLLPINDNDQNNDNLNKSLILVKKNLKKKNSTNVINQHYIINSDLTQDFEANFSIDNFYDFIEDFYKIKIEKGELEKSITPKFRNLNDIGIKNNKLNESRVFVGYNRGHIKKLNIHLIIYMIWLGFICIYTYIITINN